MTDLSSENPLIVSGRYRGRFPESLKAKGILSDLSDCKIDLKIETVRDIPLDLVRKQRMSLFFSYNILSFSTSSCHVCRYTFPSSFFFFFFWWGGISASFFKFQFIFHKDALLRLRFMLTRWKSNSDLSSTWKISKFVCILFSI